MPTDPADPSAPKPSANLYQTTSEAPKGGGGAFILILLLLLLGGGAAYYFLLYKPAAVAVAANPALAATPTPSASPSATPKPPSSGDSYNNAQRTQYIKQADDGFVAQVGPKQQAFTDNLKAFLAAGGVSAAGLNSKEAVAARRALVAKCQTANDDYEAFIKTQDQTYKAELQKTPLNPVDQDRVMESFAYNAQTEKNLQLRQLQRQAFKSDDELLAYLDKTYGSWSVNAGQHLAFKPASAGAPFNAIAKTINQQSIDISKLQADIKAAVDPNATPTADTPAAAGASPAATAAP